MSSIPTPYTVADIRRLMALDGIDVSTSWPSSWKSLEVLIYRNKADELRVALIPIVDFFGLGRGPQVEKVNAGGKKYGARVEMAPRMGMPDHLATSIRRDALFDYILSINPENVRRFGNYGTAPVLEWLQAALANRSLPA